MKVALGILVVRFKILFSSIVFFWKMISLLLTLTDRELWYNGIIEWCRKEMISQVFFVFKTNTKSLGISVTKSSLLDHILIPLKVCQSGYNDAPRCGFCKKLKISDYIWEYLKISQNLRQLDHVWAFNSFFASFAQD